MSRLTPEQRVDRNGRTVTRHVRATPSPGGSITLPAATLPEKARPVTGAKRFKPSRKQLERRHGKIVAAPLSNYSVTDCRIPSKALQTRRDEEKMIRWADLAYEYNASDVETYDVLSAVSRPIDALKLLSLGITTADGARDHLRRHGAEKLAADRSLLARTALERAIPADGFFTRWGRHDEQRLNGGRDPAVIADSIAIHFTAVGATVASDPSASIADDIAESRISFDDLKAVGFSRLAIGNRLSALRPVFLHIHAGESEWTPDHLRDLIGRCSTEGLSEFDWRKIGLLCAYSSPRQVAALSTFRHSAPAFGLYQSHPDDPRRSYSDEEAAARALYYGLVREHTDDCRADDTLDFFEAGIPPELAGQVLAAEGDVRAAQAIMDEGIQPGLSSGWL